MSQVPRRDFQMIGWIIKVNILMIGFFLVLVFIYNINTKGLPPGLLKMFGVQPVQQQTYRAKVLPMQKSEEKAKVTHQSE